MTRFTPLALRVITPRWADEVPSPAHDSLSGAERQAYIRAHPNSYLAVTQSHEDIPGALAGEVLASSRLALERLLEQGMFSDEVGPQLYVYRLDRRLPDGTTHRQTGLVGGLAIADFEQGELRPHERIHHDRAAHMAQHLDAVGVQSSPVAVAVRTEAGLGPALARYLEVAGPPAVEARGRDGLTQQIWPVRAPESTEELIDLLDRVPSYLIDGHHRAAATAIHGESWLLSAVFPADELRNQAFNRVVHGVTLDQVLGQLDRAGYLWRAIDAADLGERDSTEIAVGTSATWVAVRLPLGADALDQLDPVRIDRVLLQDVLGIDSGTRGHRISYLPGSRDPSPPSDALLCLSRPVEVDAVLAVADAGQVLPPKSTYFEPKVRSGVFLRTV